MITCVVPVRNEAGSLPELLLEIDAIHYVSEIILVEGGSTDESFEVAVGLEENFKKLLVIKQTGKGKFDAVIEGISKSTNELVVIWDADRSVPSSDIFHMIEIALTENCFVTGNRLSGTREKGAMRFFNLLGNYAFSLLFAILLKGRYIDTLCGAKIFPVKILEAVPLAIIKSDPFGDFTFLAGAIFSGTKIRSEPVNYKARTYGITNIKRWRSGLILLRLYIVIALKFMLLKLALITKGKRLR